MNKNIFFNIVERLKQKTIFEILFLNVLFTFSELPSKSLSLYYINMCCSISLFHPHFTIVSTDIVSNQFQKV